MRSYASISPMFWTRGSGKALRGDANAQVVALYLMSSPATSMIGIFHLALPTLCHETGLGLQAARKGLARCSEEGIAFWDEAEELVFVPALAKHQIGETLKPTDHKVKGVARELAPFKSHRFFRLFCDRYGQTFHLPSELLDSLSQAPLESLGRDDVPVLSCSDPVLEGVQGETAAPAKATRPPARWRRFPADWQPRPEELAWAWEHWLDADHEAAKIRDYEYDKPKTDPDACFRTWLRNAWERKGSPKPRARAAAPVNLAADKAKREAEFRERQRAELAEEAAKLAKPSPGAAATATVRDLTGSLFRG